MKLAPFILNVGGLIGKLIVYRNIEGLGKLTHDNGCRD